MLINVHDFSLAFRHDLHNFFLWVVQNGHEAGIEHAQSSSPGGFPVVS
jgi:hypothetical protein